MLSSGSAPPLRFLVRPPVATVQPASAGAADARCCGAGVADAAAGAAGAEAEIAGRAAAVTVTVARIAAELGAGGIAVAEGFAAAPLDGALTCSY